VRDADNQVDQVGELVEEVRERSNDNFDPLGRAEQSEREQDASARQPEPGLADVALVGPHVRDTVWNDADRLARDRV
jgi:hypothetical protein